MRSRSKVHWSRNGTKKTKGTQGSTMKIKTNRNRHFSSLRENHHRRCIAKRVPRILRNMGREETENAIENLIRKIQA